MLCLIIVTIMIRFLSFHLDLMFCSFPFLCLPVILSLCLNRLLVPHGGVPHQNLPPLLVLLCSSPFFVPHFDIPLFCLFFLCHRSSRFVCFVLFSDPALRGSINVSAKRFPGMAGTSPTFIRTTVKISEHLLYICDQMHAKMEFKQRAPNQLSLFEIEFKTN